jgi:NAD+ diphosphatase
VPGWGRSSACDPARAQPGRFLYRRGPPPFEEFGEFQDLRFLGTVLPPDEANLAAHARALVLWHASQMFCGVCGTGLRPEAGGNTRICMNADCGRVTFPRVDPAIIVLVSDGERCLLGRQASWPEDRYSTIAGFALRGDKRARRRGSLP